MTVPNNKISNDPNLTKLQNKNNIHVNEIFMANCDPSCVEQVLQCLLDIEKRRQYNPIGN